MLRRAHELLYDFSIRSLVRAPFFRFLVIGATTTSLDIALFSLLARLVGLSPAPSNLMSYSICVALSFVLNRYWTFGRFRGSSHVWQEALRFAMSNMAGLALSTTLVSLIARLLPDVIAKIVSVPIVFVWNYLLARYWVFRPKTVADRPQREQD